MKKVLSLVLSLVLMVSMLAACGNKEAGVTAEEEKEEPITLTIYSQTANYSGEMTGWFAQIMLERFNVKIHLVPDTDGVYDTRMEAGNLGDIIIWGGDGDDYKGAVEAGLLFDWNEDALLDDFGPYIKENMSYALQKNMDINGGLLYGFGHNVATSGEDHESFFYTWDLRWDLYKELGYPEVKTIDDYLEMLTQMKEIAPTDDQGNPTYAVSLWPDWDGTMVMYPKSMATAYYGHDELGMGLYNTETGEIYDALMPDGPYLTMLKFFNDLYQRDLLDPDSMTQTFDEAMTKVQNGGTFFSIFNFAGSIPYNTDEHVAEDKMMLTLVPEEANTIVYGMNVLGGERVWSIGAKSQYPELCMEIINWLSTPEGRMTSEYGPQGITWDYDEEGNTYGTELGILMHNDKEIEFPADTGYYGKFNDGSFQLNNTTWSVNSQNPDSNGETYNWDFWKSNQIPPKNTTEADWRDYVGFETIQDYLDSTNYSLSYASAYSESRKSDELKVVWEQVIKSIKDYSWKAIYAKTDKEFEMIVKQMISTADNYGYDECVEWTLNEAATRKTLEDALK